MSSLIAGLVLVAASVILFLIISHASRSNKSTGFFSDGWVANVHAPLVVGLFAFGSGYLVKFALIALA